MRAVLDSGNQKDKLNSRVGKTLTYKELMEMLSKRPTNKIKALIS